MPDGKLWTTHNLNLITASSFCYDDKNANCLQSGRLYTWQSAQQACNSLGEHWRLPTDDDWRRLAKYFGGVVADSNDNGKSAFEALLAGGSSGFNAVLSGGRDASNPPTFKRLGAHGFYWTATESGVTQAWFYNFAKGSQLLNRHEGEKTGALAVRCIHD